MVAFGLCSHEDKTFLTFWYKSKQQVKIVKKFFFYFKVFVIYYFVEYYRPLLKTFSVTNLDTLSRTTTLVSCQRIINDCLCTKYFFSEKVFVISFPSHLKTEIITRGEMYSQNLSVIYNCFLHIVLCLNFKNVTFWSKSTKISISNCQCTFTTNVYSTIGEKNICPK